MNKEKITHSELIKISAKWLKKHNHNIKNPQCTLILEDLVAQTSSGEVPDVLGFNYWASVMIEVKVSRDDFLGDKKKMFRRKEHLGMGEFRYYCCPEGMIKESDLPAGWGLLWLNEKKKIDIIVEPTRKQSNGSCEITMLLSKIRRMKKEHKEEIKAIKKA
jgi:ribonuclease HI